MAPCLLGNAAEIELLSERLGYDVRSHLAFEYLPGVRQWQVRISQGGKPCVLWNREIGCTVHDIKPQGGREYECWTPATLKLTYYWSETELRKAGFRLPQSGM